MKVEEFNALGETGALDWLKGCCGSERWGCLMIERRPFESVADLVKAGREVDVELQDDDWLEAFGHHPRIGDLSVLRERFNPASSEQASVGSADEETLQALKDLNDRYFDKFGFIFIVCATGKSAGEMLEMLKARVDNSRPEELQNAAAEQSKITTIRLEKHFE